MASSTRSRSFVITGTGAILTIDGRLDFVPKRVVIENLTAGTRFEKLDTMPDSQCIATVNATGVRTVIAATGNGVDMCDTIGGNIVLAAALQADGDELHFHVSE